MNIEELSLKEWFDRQKIQFDYCFEYWLKLHEIYYNSYELHEWEYLYKLHKNKNYNNTYLERKNKLTHLLIKTQARQSRVEALHKDQCDVEITQGKLLGTFHVKIILNDFVWEDNGDFFGVRNLNFILMMNGLY